MWRYPRWTQVRHPLDVVPPILVNVEVRTIRQGFVCLSSTRHIKARAVDKRLHLRWQSLAGGGRCNNPRLPPSTCYLVCGSQSMAVRHCCITSYHNDHATFAVYAFYYRRRSLCLERAASPQPFDLTHSSCCEPHYQEAKAN